MEHAATAAEKMQSGIHTKDKTAVTQDQTTVWSEEGICAAYPLLSRIQGPADLKALPESDIPVLCEEIRHCLVETVRQNGGHLASNLGVVELTVAMHRVFDCPHDHFIFDVGHQSYVHKLLTGRFDRFDTLRQGGGISGFTNRFESEYDCFGAGHSSTSISAALGFAQADRLAGSDAVTVAVVGDGAFTGGMIHEALNNMSQNLRLVVIVNENEMSISKNIGRFATHLAKLRRRPGYFRTKEKTARVMKKIPLVGNGIFRAVRFLKKSVKNGLYRSNYFEDLGLYYLGPVDGNDYESVAALLTEASKLDENVVVHVKTVKGKGYAPAEQNPGAYHGVSPGCHGEPVSGGNGFSCRVGHTLCALAKKDEKLCAITAAMGEGTGLEAFRTAYPDRFFDVGIAEEHAMTFAAGLAAEGYHPVTAIYSTFLQRGYDQIIHDIALQNLPVVMCIDRAGLNQGDGATHHGVFDVAFLSHIPNVTLYTPATYAGVDLALEAALGQNGPVAIRYPNGREDERVSRTFYPDGPAHTIGIRTHFNGQRPDAVVAVHGRMAAEALRAVDILAAEGVCLGVLLLEYLKPYDRLAEELVACLPDAQDNSDRKMPLLFAEEEVRAGGFGMMLTDALRDHPAMDGRRTAILAVEDPFARQTCAEPIRHTVGVDGEAIAAKIREMLTESK